MVRGPLTPSDTTGHVDASSSAGTSAEPAVGFDNLAGERTAFGERAAAAADPELAHGLLLTLQSKKDTVLSGIAALLESGAIEDETDRSLVVAAVAFVENPTENLTDIMNHTTNIGLVLGGYEMQGVDVPPAIDAMHSYLFALQCINRIDFVEEELKKSPQASPEIQQAMVFALDWATILSKGYKDDTYLTAIRGLQARLMHVEP